MDLWTELHENYCAMPTLEYYKAEKKYTDAAFVIFPGGAYSGLAPHEGQGYAKWFNSLGADAFVVKYSVRPMVFPAQLCDARRAVQIIRSKAEEFEINPEKIIAVGSSAGGHLAAMLSTYRGDEIDFENDEISRQNFLPNYQVLCYPVIDMEDEAICHLGSKINLLGENCSEELVKKLNLCDLCDENTPPAFIWHTAEDGDVHVFNSINYAKSLIGKGVPCECHIFPFGAHGCAIAPGIHTGQWRDLLFNWLKEMKIY